MADRLPRLVRGTVVTEKGDKVSEQLARYMQRFAEMIEAQIGALEAAQAAQAAAETAQAAAETAQAAAEAAQATADAIEVPPSGVVSVSVNTALTPDHVTALVDTTSGDITITLSNASGYSVPVAVTNTNGTNDVLVVPSGSDSLNLGPGPVVISIGGETKTFVADQVDQWFA